MRRIALVGLLGLAVSVSAHAQDARGPADALPGGVVQEGDVALFFDYLRDLVNAVSEGRDAPPPAELTQRAEAIGEEMKRRGTAAARALVDALESSVREGLREPRTPAPPPGHIRL